jgi:hypothetical protein
MSPEIASALISSFGLLAAAALAIWGYKKQKYSDLNASLTEMRREAYRKFLAQLPKLASSSPEQQTEYYISVADLNLIASDFVLRCVGEFSKYMNGTAQSGRDPEIYKKLIAKIAINMRKDCFEKTELGIETMAETLPFR